MVKIARRALLGTGVGAAAFSIGDALSPVRRASGRERPAGKQVPGVYRFRVGTFELTVVTSGTLSFPIEDLWPETPRAEVEAVLAADFQPTDAPVLQVNALAVNTGDRLVLIDTGSGGKFFATAGRLPASLAAAEIGLEHVDTVVFTHAHPDHLFGATDPSGTRLLYPNAEHVITDIEFDFWTAPDRVADLAEDWWRDMVQTAQGNLRRRAAASSDQARRRGRARDHEHRHRRTHARPHLVAHRLRSRRAFVHGRRRRQPRRQLPEARMARRLRHGPGQGRSGTTVLSRPMCDRQGHGCELSPALPRHRACRARWDGVPLGAGRLALGDVVAQRSWSARLSTGQVRASTRGSSRPPPPALAQHRPADVGDQARR